MPILPRKKALWWKMCISDSDWYQPNLIMSQQEALEKIYERAFQISNSLDLDQVKKIFNKQIKLLKRFSID